MEEKTVKKNIVTFAALLTASLIIALPASATTKLRFGHAGPETDSQHLAAVEFSNKVKERSRGEIEVQIFPNSTLGNDQAMIQSVRGGVLDIEMSGNPNFSGIVPKMNAFDLPYIFNDAAHAYRVLDGKTGQAMLDDLGKYGMKGLAFWEVGFRAMTNNKRPIRTPEDVRGLKIRTTPNPAHIKAFQMLGANPVPMPLSELYSALETGAVDAQEHPVGVTWSAKFNEVQKHLSMTRHAYTAMVIVMNKAKFDGLKPEHQKIILDAAAEGGKFQRELNAKNEMMMVADLKKKGMQVIENIDSAPFRKVVAEETRKLFIEKNGPDVINAIDAAR